MKVTVRNLTGALLVGVAALATGQQQAAAPELRLSDLRAQQPQEKILASAPCQRATASPRKMLAEHSAIDPRTLVPDFGTLMEKSDEVVLAAVLDSARLLSPSGESVASYFEVRVIRSWKGKHGAASELTFGVPGGTVNCALAGSERLPFTVLPGEGADWQGIYPGKGGGPYVYVLFLRQSSGEETRLVQGLRLTGGSGLQGMFLIHVPSPLPFDAERYCGDALQGSVQHCESYLQTSQNPVIVAYVRDPLAKKCAGMPASDFFRKMQSVADAQGSAEESSLR
jgi:hypothetical protein